MWSQKCHNTKQKRVSWIVRNWHFVLVAGLTYQPNASVFDNPGIIFSILQIVPLSFPQKKLRALSSRAWMSHHSTK